MKYLVFVMAILTVLSCGNKKKVQAQNGNSPIHLVSASEFEQKLASMQDVQLIDVRTPEEFQSGYIKGAININYQGNNFAEEVAKLDKSKPVFVYCRSGGRSGNSAAFMADQGFKEIYDLDGGISNWSFEKKPVEKPAQN